MKTPKVNKGEFLSLLKAYGTTTVVVSQGDEELGLKPYVLIANGADEVLEAKPSPLWESLVHPCSEGVVDL